MTRRVLQPITQSRHVNKLMYPLAHEKDHFTCPDYHFFTRKTLHQTQNELNEKQDLLCCLHAAET